MTRTPKKLAKRFNRDEDGAVMIITIILMLLLVKVMFSTFNVGVLTAERMRLQMVSDTAAYSSAVWQARFLNHCAYTKRAIIANYANAALFTAMEANKQSWDFYDDEDPNAIPGCSFGQNIDPDNWPYPTPTTRGSMKILGPLYDFTAGQFSDDENARNTAEALSHMYSVSQEVMYEYVSRPWLTVIPEILEASNLPVGGRDLLQIEMDPNYKSWVAQQFSNDQAGMLNESFLRQVDLSELEEDIKDRYDEFTVGSGTLQSLPFFVSRPFWGFDMLASHLWTYPSDCTVTVYPCINPNDVQMAIFYFTNSGDFETDIDSSSGSYATDDNIRMWNVGSYFMGWQWAWTPFTGFFCVPVYSPILDNQTWDVEYDFDKDPDDIETYALKENLPPSQHEPSVYVALRIKREDIVGDGEGLFHGRVFHNKGVPLGNQVRELKAISRAKVYFQPRWTSSYYEPNLYYPYWEAKLAPVFGPGYDDANSVLRENGVNLLEQVLPAGTSAQDYARRIHY